MVVDGNRVDDFDFESVNKCQLAGNIYLAKVIRVEPSLQAAFVDYGGNRHGFLPFSEIHPDYYQIPVADRRVLLEEEERAAREEGANENDAETLDKPKRSRRSRSRKEQAPANLDQEIAGLEAAPVEDLRHAGGESGTPVSLAIVGSVDSFADTPVAADNRITSDAPVSKETVDVSRKTESDAVSSTSAPIDSESQLLKKSKMPPDEAARSESPETMTEGTGIQDERIAEEIDNTAAQTERLKRTEECEGTPSGLSYPDDDIAKEFLEELAKPENEGIKVAGDERSGRRREIMDDADSHAKAVESVGAEDLREEVAVSRARRRHNYKIQDVIKVRQIMLTQVVKEERGNKGAALTTYLSLAGRYCVLMPNTARGGGISRKITQAGDRKHLREIVDGLGLPKGMGLIVRTAGAERTRAEIKRDYEFLSRQWEQIRDLTMKSIAPCLIYEEGSLIKRSIRDLYSKGIDIILVEGENGYREAKDYMQMLMPSHARNVQQYTDQSPLFIRYQIESTLNGVFSPTVQLKSGGYIVIGVTEALVAIDVNSGRATKHGSIEETALQTNLEAADEVARQCRLRDLAGLIVIDFIDMEESHNNRMVEKRLKEQLKTDRARIQIGRISSFGLMEMSRQRLRPGMLEVTTIPCGHCSGMGIVRSDESMALSVLREIEEEGVRNQSTEIRTTVPVNIANFLLNHKRIRIAQIEKRYDISISIIADTELTSPTFQIERSKRTTRAVEKIPTVVTAVSSAASDESRGKDAVSNMENDEKREGRSNRRGQRGGRKKRGMGAMQSEKESLQTSLETESIAPKDNEKKSKRPRRRRRNKGGEKAELQSQASEDDTTANKAPSNIRDTNTIKKTSNAFSEASESVSTQEPSARSKRWGWWSLDI